MKHPSDTNVSAHALMERARHTLQSLQYHEQAARYKAAAASLQAAMIHAENGKPEQLQYWLEQESNTLKHVLDGSDLDQTASELKPQESVRFLRVDSPTIASTVIEPTLPTKTPGSPWAKMERAAEDRLAALQETPLQKTHEWLELSDRQESHQAEPAMTSDFCLELPEDTFCRGRLTKMSPVLGMSWWMAPHVWVSLVVHVLLIVCLGLIAISVAKTPQLLAIVSSPVEADNVLLEDPMEVISEMEVAEESTPSKPAYDMSELTSAMASNDFAINIDASNSTPTSISSSVLNETSESSTSAKIGSQTVAGAEFFGVKATGNTFVYIVDSSPSMRRGGAFEAARKEIVRSLQSMKPKQRYFVSFFGKEIDPMVFDAGVVERFPVYAKPENLAKTIDWLGRVQVQKEGLPPNNALAEAIAMQPDGIFLLFDGDTKVDVAKFLRRTNRTDDVVSAEQPKVPIHVIHFFQDEFQSQMKRVAEENGGTYRFVPSPERSSKGNR